MATTIRSARVPGPRAPLGWRGQALAFLRDPIAFMALLRRQYGELASVQEGYQWWMFAFGPAYNQQVLSDAALFHSVAIAPLTTPPNSALARLTRNLLSMNGDTHKQQRRLMLPAFHRKRVEGYRDAIVALAEHELDTWQVGQQLDIARAMQRLTLRIASRTLFGVDAAGDADSVGRLIDSWMATLESGGVLLLPRDLPATPFRKLLRLSDQLEARVQAVIARKRASPAGQPDVLSMLIEARDDDGVALTDEELIGQASLVFIAGHETSSNALTWTLFLLSQHPRILAELCDELAGVLRGGAPTVEQLARLPLLDRVLKESMRLLPPASFMMRYTTRPAQLGPHTLPAGATVTVSPYITHHSPALYPDPQRFDPARWERIAPGTYEYMPFGAGPHMCLGSTFATIEIKIVLALLLQRYRLELAPGARIDRRVKITMSPRWGMPMHVLPQGSLPRPVRVRGNVRQMVELG
ncbi:MAG TPA: cytochrome P450 [Kouleothrix sp.]|uniref:cytochrome P450 n=1 Tax=Kouleothrix sp. TaxID=2779161 RepID=UPI002D11E1FB|nr:cytochrome P450 [Kouleothrix sp.]